MDSASEYVACDTCEVMIRASKMISSLDETSRLVSMTCFDTNFRQMNLTSGLYTSLFDEYSHNTIGSIVYIHVFHIQSHGFIILPGSK